MPQVQATADLCYVGAAPQSARNAPDDVRLLLVQPHLELCAVSGNGGGLFRRLRAAGRPALKARRPFFILTLRTIA